MILREAERQVQLYFFAVQKIFFFCKISRQLCPGKQVSSNENPTMPWLVSVYKVSSGSAAQEDQAMYYLLLILLSNTRITSSMPQVRRKKLAERQIDFSQFEDGTIDEGRHDASSSCSEFEDSGYHCVPYYQCDNCNTIIVDGTALFDPRTSCGTSKEPEQSRVTK